MSFFGSLFGSDQAKDLKRAKAASDKQLQAGYDEAAGLYDQAGDLYNPYAERGEQGSAVYSQAIGLGTPEQQKAAQARYFNDPAQAAMLGQSTNALLRKFNSQGSGTGGGRLALAGQRVATEQYGNWLDRVQGVGAGGLQATGAQSNVLLGKGDLRYGLGATQAGNSISYGNAQAQNRSTGINNLLKIGEIGVKAFAASDIRLKRDIRKLGHLPSGLPYYSFKYIDDDGDFVGVMAQEAAVLFPDAIGVMDNGFFCVDYNRIS